MQRTERRSCGAGSPHVENRAALHAEPGAHRALIFRGNKNRHAGKPVRAPLAHRLHRTEHAGKYLPIAADFDARLDNVANAGNAHFIAGRNNFEPSGFDGFFLQDRPFDGRLIDRQSTRCKLKAIAQLNTGNGKLCHLKTHYSSLA